MDLDVHIRHICINLYLTCYANIKCKLQFTVLFIFALFVLFIFASYVHYSYLYFLVLYCYLYIYLTCVYI